MVSADNRKRRVQGMRTRRFRWHLDEALVKINRGGITCGALSITNVWCLRALQARDAIEMQR